MALLSANDRARGTRSVVRRIFVEADITANLSGADIRAAFDATDDWIEANANAFNTALPLPARTTLTAGQKTVLFCAAALARAGLLEDAL